MSNTTKIKKAASYLKAISHPTRLQIILLLKAKNSLTVSEICDRLDVEQSLVSHHLASMRRRGVLEAERNGINISYGILDPKVLEVVEKVFQSKAIKN